MDELGSSDEAGRAVPVEAELRTFLIADIRGYTSYTRDRGADVAAELVAQFAAIVREVVATHDGYLLELRGDEALAVFVLARRALRAALELQTRFGRELDRGVGIGLDSGEAIPVEGGYRGSALNLAARLCAQAGPGDVLASEAVIHLAAKVDGIGYADPRTYRLKGMAEPVRAVHVVPAERASTGPIRYRGEGGKLRWTFVGLIGVTLLAAVVIAGAFVLFNRPHDRVALLRWRQTDIEDLMQTGFSQGAADFSLVGTVRQATSNNGGADLRALATSGNRLIIAFVFDQEMLGNVAHDFPELRFVLMDDFGTLPGISYVVFDDQESSYLAGAAAALVSRTGKLGFVGGVDIAKIWRFEAGFVAGAKSVKPDIAIATEYLSEPPDFSGFASQSMGQDAAERMYRNGADVVFEVAGNSSYGGMEAAASLSAPLGRQLWTIGVDSDQYDTVGNLAGVVDPEAWREHILTSVIKHWDRATYNVVSDFANGELEPGVVDMRLDDEGVDISYSGGFLDAVKAQLEQIRAAIIAGEVAVPCVPAEKVGQATSQGTLPVCRR